MVNFWYIKGDFYKERSGRIGASDIPALIPNPENPTETLAGYGRTPISVWQEKTGRKEREPAGLPAEMGHYLEDKAAELFIRYFDGEHTAYQHIWDRFSSNAAGGKYGAYQNTPYHHHAQYYRDGMIVHPDVIHEACTVGGRKSFDGVTVDTRKEFLVEAKSASYWSAKRPEGSIVKGYDFSLKTWQGVPLSHYMQIQFQLALLECDMAYLALIHNTNQFSVWEIKANRQHQGKLIDLAGKMAWHIQTDTAPRELAMNVSDIMALYPDIGDDFYMVRDEEREKAREIQKKYIEADRQAKAWEARKNDAKDAMAVILKDYAEVRDSEGIIAKWQSRKASERIKALSEIISTDPNAYKYLKRKKLIDSGSPSRFVKIQPHED